MILFSTVLEAEACNLGVSKDSPSYGGYFSSLPIQG